MKRTLTLLLTICTVLSLAACGGQKDNGNTTPTSEPTSAPRAPTSPATEPTKIPLHKIDYTVMPFEQFSEEYRYFKDVCTRHGTAWNAEVNLDIPVYYEAEIIAPGLPYRLDSDASHLLGRLGEYGNTGIEQFYYFPTNALRLREDDISYFIYDTENGYRLYVFVTKYTKNRFNNYYITGYPIVINKNKILSRNDFKEIQVGDSFEEVISVDNILESYRERFNIESWEPITFKNGKDSNNPVVSVHYLTDGILRIEYTMSEDRKITVANMEFFEDFVIPTADGEMTSHKIKDIDLPVG